MKNLNLIILLLTIIGGLNWGLIGLFHFDLVVTIFGSTVFTTIMHVLVSISAVYMLYTTVVKKLVKV